MVRESVSSCGTRKLLVQLEDGLEVETVVIPDLSGSRWAAGQHWHTGIKQRHAVDALLSSCLFDRVSSGARRAGIEWGIRRGCYFNSLRIAIVETSYSHRRQSSWHRLVVANNTASNPCRRVQSFLYCKYYQRHSRCKLQQ